jgi:hypothetical protein
MFASRGAILAIHRRRGGVKWDARGRRGTLPGAGPPWGWSMYVIFWWAYLEVRRRIISVVSLFSMLQNPRGNQGSKSSMPIDVKIEFRISAALEREITDKLKKLLR